jgi:hypothetical protein
VVEYVCQQIHTTLLASGAQQQLTDPQEDRKCDGSVINVTSNYQGFISMLPRLMIVFRFQSCAAKTAKRIQDAAMRDRIATNTSFGR